MGVVAFLEKGKLARFGVPLLKLGFDDVASLSDRELLTDAILSGKDVGMSKVELRKFRQLVATMGTSPSLHKQKPSKGATITKMAKESAGSGTMI